MGNISNILYVVIVSTIRMSVPMILASTGAAFSVRSGIMAMGCEGMMIAGAFFGVFGSFISGSPWIGILFGIVSGVLFSLLHGFLNVRYKVNQTLSGMSVNLLAAAIAPLILQIMWKSKGISPKVASFDKLEIGLLSKIPFIGTILAEQNILFYITILIVIVGWIYMFKTPQGLRMRMVGENPVAANTVGINVALYKYIGVMISGALCGLAGAYLSLAQLNMYVDGMTAGRGYIAMVIATFGKNNPLGALGASLFFGFFDSLQTIFQGSFIPSHIVRTLPYVLTMLVVVFGLKSSRNPAGLGKYHDE
ncbi:branched-chain amino acid ABC transporter permease [Tissierella sp. P1]|uniref:ABC transporter permease n=1 Tax=Tissierella sp. P1 TaxID=1280483 RepID=UPI000BA131A7|nr:ABC transporter permease [Tissierella sp. P1]OZV14108.1 branched-chain amino acid ABC transporter permease [Tissierella sp. P1]